MSGGSHASQSDHAGGKGESSATTFLNAAFAAAILIAPIAFTVGGLLDPVVHVTNGAANIEAYTTANPLTNALHLAAFVRSQPDTAG